jgi:hypothetical protein
MSGGSEVAKKDAGQVKQLLRRAEDLETGRALAGWSGTG